MPSTLLHRRALARTSRSETPWRVFIRCEDAERFIEEVRGVDPEAGAKLRIEERKLDAGLNQGSGRRRRSPPPLAPPVPPHTPREQGADQPGGEEHQGPGALCTSPS